MEKNNVTTKNPVGLSGNVTLTKLDKKGKVKKKLTIKNMVVVNLLVGLGYYLIGSNDLGVCPEYLGLGYKIPLSVTQPTQTRLEEEYSINRLKLNKSGVIINSDNSVSVKYTTTLYYTTLLGKEINELGLFSNSTGDNLLARVYLPNTDDIITLDIGESVVITWMVTINNTISEVNN